MTLYYDKNIFVKITGQNKTKQQQQKNNTTKTVIKQNNSLRINECTQQMVKGQGRRVKSVNQIHQSQTLYAVGSGNR